MKKWVTPIIYVVALSFAFIYRNEIFEWLQANDSFLLLLGLATVLALFPILPYKAVIAVLGYTYGIFWGALVAWLGTTIAAMIIYAAAASIYRDSGRRFLAKFKSLDKFTSAFEQHPFKAIVIARLIPIVPQMAVNIYAGVASIPFWSYTIASGLGKIPAIFTYAFLGNGLANKPIPFTMITFMIAGIAGISFAVYYEINRPKKRI